MTDTDALRAAAEAWLAADPEEDTRAELRRLLDAGDVAELEGRFGARLEFGTAGLRGTFGAGPNRMNRAVVIRATAGLAHHLLAAAPDARARGVVIGYDGRRHSRTFAEDAACVLAAAGIPAHLFPHVVPTPLAAFAVNNLGAAAGIMVTASHNPPDYNGYKVYWGNGAQIVPPVDVAIAQAIDASPGAASVPRLALDDRRGDRSAAPGARAQGLVREIGPELEDRYLARVAALGPHPHVRPPLRIVYTPLHGSGGRVAMAAFARAGFGDVQAVAEQFEPDAAFPTVAFPNPEEKGAMDLALALARSTGAELVLANDPDADRLAVALPDGQGGFVQLTGNEVGVLLGHYLLTEGGDATSPDRLVVSTIVSSPMLGGIARALGVAYEETLTGFKWIANRAMQLAREKGLRFVFGYEEALGYSVGELVRDKDGIGAAVVVAELASVCKRRGRTLLDELERIARGHGLWVSGQRSVTVEGADGKERMARMMAGLRASPPASIAGLEVLAARDLLARTRTAKDGTKTPVDLPPSDVLVWELAGGSRVIVRPSGTEPKVKLYFDHREAVAPGEPIADARARGRAVLAAMDASFAHLG